MLDIIWIVFGILFMYSTLESTYSTLEFMYSTLKSTYSTLEFAWMEHAIAEAEKAELEGEVPIGAIVVADNQIIAQAHNEVEKRGDATAHAEILAIQEASKATGNWRLSDCSLFVTLEPCTMCIGAAILSRIPRLYFGCYDPRQGAVGSLFNLSQHTTLPHSVEVYSGLLEEKCKALLSQFFKSLRPKGTQPSRG